ncbi:MAG: HAD-IB family hydrolase [Acidimicrobiia bacterium]|nr:HAD-IB family hydrolase [Acidimicrobiia bacterium]
MAAAFFVLERAVSGTPATRALGRAALSHGLVPRSRVLRRSWSGVEGHDPFRTNLLDAFAGTRSADLDALGPEIVGPVVVGVHSGAYSRLRAHAADGIDTYLLSAVPQTVVDRVAAALGMTGAIGTPLEVGSDGRFTGRLTGPFCSGDGRIEAVQKLAAREGHDLADCWAYASSADDLPLLGSVGHPVAVNPDRSLAADAEAAGWATLRFVPRHHLRVTAAAGAAAGAMAVAAAAVLWLSRRPAA